MVSKKNNQRSPAIALLAVIKIFLLILLTSANFFGSSIGDSELANITASSQEEEAGGLPGAPTGPDEKSPGEPVSISEEFLHSHDDHPEVFIAGLICKRRITDSEKIELIHFELFSPPPEC